MGYQNGNLVSQDRSSQDRSSQDRSSQDRSSQDRSSWDMFGSSHRSSHMTVQVKFGLVNSDPEFVGPKFCFGPLIVLELFGTQNALENGV